MFNKDSVNCSNNNIVNAYKDSMQTPLDYLFRTILSGIICCIIYKLNKEK